jgi:UDP-N-acetylmuramyl pentapeptide phosphotransferase/UDP-N-acetylglucosamine-1-phosphate transferase
MFDTLRVFTIRILRGGSPFKADRRHLHHLLLDLGFSHLNSTLILVVFNAAIIAYAYFFNFLGNSTIVFSLIFFGAAMSFLVMLILRNRVTLLKTESGESNKIS